MAYRLAQQRLRRSRRLQRRVAAGTAASRGPRCASGRVHAGVLLQSALQFGWQAWKRSRNKATLAGTLRCERGCRRRRARSITNDLRPRHSADLKREIREFVAGTGGKSLRPIAPAVLNSEVRNAETFGVLKLTLRTNGYDWQFIPVPGKALRIPAAGPVTELCGLTKRGRTK